ncbi:MAG: butyrate kinase [Deltaproteobacteria bacterium]|nr:butyrate kinase [Deltaproteobacteria bacterium]
MKLADFQNRADSAQESRENARGIGRELTTSMARLLDRVRPGEEDPVLIALLGEDLAGLVKRTRWSSLVVNPGSTSTKVAAFNGLTLVAEDEVHIEPGEPDGVSERAEHVAEWAERAGIDLRELTGIAARGGFVAPVPVATYRVSEEMCADLERAPYNHASNMAVPMALELGKLVGEDVVVTITDPVTCDEVDLVHRITGSAHIRTDGAAIHYLNLRAVFELFSHHVEAKREDLHLLGCHMGGGMSAARSLGGRLVQVAHAFGTFPSANRSGSLPLKEVLRLIECHEYTFDDLRKDVVESGGGLLALAGTNDFRAFLNFRDSGADPNQIKKIDLITEFFANRVAAGILELSAAKRPLDAILLTGGLARNGYFLDLVEERLPLPVPVVHVPGSVESQSLAAGLLRACADRSSRRNYSAARDQLAKKRADEDALLDVALFEKPVYRKSKRSRLTTLDDIISAAYPKSEPLTIGIVGADNDEALLAAKLANREGAYRLARFVLLGPFARISSLAWELDIPIDEDNYFIIDTDDAVGCAGELFSAGALDILMKGSTTTASLLKGYFKGLKAAGRLRQGTILSHLSLCELPGRSKLVGVTDAAINPQPDLETRVKILENALHALHVLGVARPRVAVISATEKPSDKVLSSVESEEIAERFQGREDLIIEGPISVDLALSRDAAEEKRYNGRIKGDADLLLVPDIDVGNAVYKVFSVAGGATMAGAVIGGDVPLILTSRGDSSRTKFASIALGLVLAQKERTL